MRHERRNHVPHGLEAAPVGEWQGRRAPVRGNRRRVIKIGVLLLAFGKAAQPAVCRAEPQLTVQHRQTLCRHIDPEKPRRIAVFLGQRAVRDINVSVYCQIIFALEYHRTGVFEVGLLR